MGRRIRGWSVLAAVFAIILVGYAGTFLVAHWFSHRHSPPETDLPDEDLHLVILVPNQDDSGSGIAYVVSEKELLSDLARQLRQPTFESGPRMSGSIIGTVYFHFGSTSRAAALTSNWTTLPHNRGLHRIDLRRVLDRLKRDHKEPVWFFGEPPKLD
jgi:hypothetical protein